MQDAPPILLVEDSATDAEILSFYLRKSPRAFDVTVVTDGQAALDLMRRQPPDLRPRLVLLDLNLPKLGGFEVLRAIKTDAGLCDIPVMILTASVLEEDLQRANRLEADAYLSKPFDSEGFKEVVETVERMVALPERNID